MDDLISRQAALDVCNTRCEICKAFRKHSGEMCAACYLDGIADAIEDLPSAQPEKQNGWISVENEKPKDHKAVNVIWVNHNPSLYYANIKDIPQTGTAHYYKPSDCWYWDSPVCDDYLDEYGDSEWRVDEAIKITHWQPLPELPEKEGDSNV